jgi:aspartate/methionine/tyrosine aminotransferase
MVTWQQFELEEWQSTYEQTVDFNLSDSTIDPVPTRLLVAGDAELTELLDTGLYYPEVNGERALRERIAALYPRTGPDDVLVTVGASEANAAIVDALCPPGRRVHVMEPGYRQVWGLARNKGCEVVGFPLRPEHGWRPDLDALEASVDETSALIYVCNPNNPAGYVLTEAEMDWIVAIAAAAGCWLVADEVYVGSEHNGRRTPTFVGRYDKVIGVNSMSKSYGLSGLRIGWVVASPDVIAMLWRRHEYAAIATGRLDNLLARLALTEPITQTVLERNRTAMNDGWAIFEKWVAGLDGLVQAHRPPATPLAFLRVAASLDSVTVGERLRAEASVLGCPGVFFGCEGYLRINVGFGVEYVADALAAMEPTIRKICEEHPA